MAPTRQSEIRDMLERSGITVRKAWGQNFILSTAVIHKIVSAAYLTKADTVLEVGPGLGSLTRRLADQADRVIAVEIDPLLCKLLRQRFSHVDNLTIVTGDVLQYNFHQLLPQRYKVVANLPYYITSHFLTRLLEQGPHPELAVILIQLEVARRLAASPGTKEYGALSVLVQYYTKPELICRVAPGNFYPRPKVSSAVTRLEWLPRPCQPRNPRLMFSLVRTAFSQRRKMLKGLVANHFGIPVGNVENLLRDLGIAANIRGEKLSVEQFCQLADSLEEMTR